MAKIRMDNLLTPEPPFELDELLEPALRRAPSAKQFHPLARHRRGEGLVNLGAGERRHLVAEAVRRQGALRHSPAEVVARDPVDAIVPAGRRDDGEGGRVIEWR